MSNEKKLEALKLAIEMGADIQINFHTDSFKPKETDKEDSEAKLKAVSDILGLGYELKDSEKTPGLFWYKAHGRGLEVTAFFHDENWNWEGV